MKRSEKIAIGLMTTTLILLIILACALSPLITLNETPDEPLHLPYEKYFDPNQVTQINIIIDNDLFQKMLETAPQKYVPCSIQINGDTYRNLGIKIKGATSKTYVQNSSTSNRYSLKIKSTTYNKKLINGLDSFVLNAELLDATMMDEYLTYELLKEAGVKTPLFAYAAVYINNKYWGLYVMVESIDKSFLKRTYGHLKGNLYRPEGTKFLIAENGTILGPDLSTNKHGGHLEYVGDNADAYNEIFANPIFVTNANEGKRNIMEIIRHLHENSDLAKYLNLDEIIAYLSVNAAIANLDSYVNWGETHNYFLYEKNGQLTIFPWDNDIAIAPYFLPSTIAVNLPIDEAAEEFLGNIDFDRLPLIKMLNTTPELHEKYHKKLRDIAENQMGEHLLKRIDEISEMIDPYLKTDPTAPFPAETYHEKAIQSLKKYITLRTQNILDQLDGKIPTTYAEQKKHPERITDIQNFTLNDMGTLDTWKKLWP